MFTQSDISQLKKKGISQDTAEDQLALIRRGSFSLKILRAAGKEDGITLLTDEEKERYKDLWLKEKGTYKTEKFVPASGAATRMFKDLFSFLSGDTPSSEVVSFFRNLQDFPFFDHYKELFSSKGWFPPDSPEKQRAIAEFLLDKDGENWGAMPKGLIPFHRKEEKLITPTGEHLAEGRSFAADPEGLVRVHFTITPSAENDFRKTVEREQQAFPENRFEVSYSFQDPSTDTLALDDRNQPFRKEDGTLLFRPGGHGSLLQNLNKREADFLFLKNIDNVQKPGAKEPTQDSFSQMAGFLIHVRTELKRMEEQWKKGNLPSEERVIEDLKRYCGRDFSSAGPILEKRDNILNLLNSPIRVCGMVRNEGEPGGGPFWVQEEGGESSLQIVESAQIDLKEEKNRRIMQASTHFNPVFLVCLKQDLQGQQLDLNKFSQKEACFVTEKSLQGRKLYALEHPGLWNGAMARWITLFVEIPSECFTPVKTIGDLLRKEHR